MTPVDNLAVMMMMMIIIIMAVVSCAFNVPAFYSVGLQNLDNPALLSWPATWNSGTRGRRK